ncbi:ATP-dependent nuclease [Fodinibius salsisoli]|uniref:AAA family ATPase n=1 Tax=Fodinibius salsisoli TaxID=2820877 RepID=A0ABT3PMS4_9BACT|nr:AAA family ATPase [Fodinibius salsisoli]MCW9706434.1 AAA family ATPase [Fodinibius salsisoli]
MYLSNLIIENYRTFGSKENNNHLEIDFQEGLNLLVGENDSGKSAIIDAIRHVLWTTSDEYHRITEEDFHIVGDQRKTNLQISCTFTDLTKEEAARYLEWLSLVDGEKCLIVNLEATLNRDVKNYRRRISVNYRSGKNGQGKAIEGDIREFLKTTYLKPLRDAESEMSSGRRSRLSQILEAHPDSKEQQNDNFDDENPNDFEPETLVDIMRQAEYLIKNNDYIEDSESKINQDYLNEFSIGDDTISGELGISKKASLREILEKFELWIRPEDDKEIRTKRGLGINNILFMATELLLLSSESDFGMPLLLIEEPEAHLHPPMQVRLMDFLEEKAGLTDQSLQIITSTHSPNISSKVNPQNLIMVGDGNAYSLKNDQTKLSEEDYQFLKRFLDVTKANLFFAKGVVIVEGDAENLLIPTLAKLIGCSFSKNGISIVNVGHTGLFRYSRIFQQCEEDKEMPIRVACIADIDIPSDFFSEGNNDADKHYKKTERDYSDEDRSEKKESLQENDGKPVYTFVAENWTLEYDLIKSGLGLEMLTAINLANDLNYEDSDLADEKEKIISNSKDEYDALISQQEDEADLIYNKFFEHNLSKTVVAQELSHYLEEEYDRSLEDDLPEYIVDAIKYVTRNKEFEDLA